MMTKTKVKPNPKDLLKKAFAHKNTDGLNPPPATTEQKAEAVFSDLEPIAVQTQMNPEDVLTSDSGNAELSNTDDVLPAKVGDILQSDSINSHDITTESDGDSVIDSINQDFVYTNEVDILEAPQSSFIDDLIDNATTEDIFTDTPVIEVSLGHSNFNDEPPETGFVTEVADDEPYSNQNKETLTLLEQVKADKDARGRENQKNLNHLAALESEHSELEEIMRQQLIKQQEEEAAKLNEGIEKIRTRNSNFLKLLGILYKKETDAIQADNLVGIAQSFKADNTITLQSYLVINRYLHRFNIQYDMEQIRVFLNEELLNIETPPLDFDYYYLWESNLDNKITPYMWDKHKLMVFSRANFTCELCNGVGVNNPVELYPHWRLFDSNRTQILHGFLALCPKCVDAKNHAQLKQRNLKMRYESAREHIKAVNGWDDRQVENALLESDEMYAKRVDARAEPERFKKWKLNIHVLETLFGVPIEEPQFNQRSHIKSNHHQIFEPHVSYLFGKIESDRMMKTGKTKFLSIKLDVEVMKTAR